MQIGEKRAKQIVYFSEKVAAEKALEWGWVNEVVDDDDLEATVREWAERLLELHPQSLQIAKAASNVWWNLSYDSMLNGLELIAMGVAPAVRGGGARGLPEQAKARLQPLAQVTGRFFENGY